jgi:hypothetical protein
MSIEQLNTTALGATDVTLMAAAIDKNSKGLAQITISEYDSDSACVVKVGSVFECNGATFLVSGTDETPTGYDDITVSTAFYLYYDESEDEFIYSETAPTWSDSLQGWYNGNDRAFFSMYKDSTGVYYNRKRQIKNKPIGAKYIYEISNETTYGDVYDSLRDIFQEEGIYPADGVFESSSGDLYSIIGIRVYTSVLYISMNNPVSATITSEAFNTSKTDTAPLYIYIESKAGYKSA